VEINLGFGTMTFHPSEIDRVVKSDAKETDALWQDWGTRQKEIDRRKPAEEKKWRARQAELERIHAAEVKAQTEKDVYGPKDIRVSAQDGAMWVNVLLNDKIRATLVLDSGASNVLLSKRIAEKLEIDLDKLKKTDVRVADGRTVSTFVTTLESVQVQDKDATDSDKENPTGVMVKDVPVSFNAEPGDNKDNRVDGLLGMSFLRHFKFNTDFKNSQVTFERLKEEKA